ncbi:MAG: hypothetical protein CMF12_13935 [Idiomarina sp.]|uniref:hypothetical protein n=1 Tax=Idiomarina sp. TaxID=1874361 RepID=UPI000C5E51A5|nr:hypothetical protein [Idiomarina sp.]MBT43606.1 hypothetical protein [Idiomarina sp.]
MFESFADFLVVVFFGVLAPIAIVIAEFQGYPLKRRLLQKLKSTLYTLKAVAMTVIGFAHGFRIKKNSVSLFRREIVFTIDTTTLSESYNPIQTLAYNGFDTPWQCFFDSIKELKKY